MRKPKGGKVSRTSTKLCSVGSITRMSSLGSSSPEMFCKPHHVIAVYRKSSLTSSSRRFQPAGVVHAVMTILKAITAGHHYLTLDSLHLTEFARRIDHKRSTEQTNADHSSIQSLVRRMVIALRFRPTGTGEPGSCPIPSVLICQQCAIDDHSWQWR